MKTRIFAILFLTLILTFSLASCGEEPHTHAWSEWITSKPATCEATGEQYRTCDCGETQVAPLPVTAHEAGEWQTVREATCTVKGEKVKSCLHCGKTMETGTIPATGNHTEGNWIVDKEPTETKEGSKHIECTVCSTVLRTESIPVLIPDHTHQWSEWAVSIPATCKSAGEQQRSCTCGEIQTAPLPKTNDHTWGDWLLTTAPTTESVGEEKRTCSVCGKNENREVAKLEPAPEPSSPGLLYFVNEDRTTCTIRGTGTVTTADIVIPTIIDGYRVTAIAENAFKDCAWMTSITIPDSVTEIGKSAFAYCTGLTSVTIGNGVTTIGSSAFSYCTSLKAVYITDIAAWCGIPFDDDDANPLYYAKNLYLNGELVTDLVIPDSVTTIGSYAFYGCSNLTSITIPDSVTSIGEYAFFSCPHLVEIRNLSSLNIVAGSEDYGYIGYYAKRVYQTGESYLSTTSDGFVLYNDGSNAILVQYIGDKTEITIPDSVTSIGRSAFEDCTSLTSITIPDSVTSIGKAAFAYCTSLTSITIPDSVTEIGKSAFFGCTGLTRVTIPDSVTSISDYAFYGCESLTSITIPDGVTYIGFSAFEDCTSLTRVTYKGTMAQWRAISKGPRWKSETGSFTVYCTDGEIAKADS